MIKTQMETIDLIRVWCKLERYARLEARKYTRQLEDQEDYIQEALIRLSRCQPGGTEAYYRKEIKRAIRAAYMRAYRKRTYKLKYLEEMDRETYECWRTGFYIR